MWWNEQDGYQFLRVDLETDTVISNTLETYENGSGGTSHSQTSISHQSSSSSGNQSHSQSSSQTTIINNGQTIHSQTSQQSSSNTFLVQIGSTGCAEEARSNLFGCANPNRPQIVLSDFVPEKNVVIADLAELLSQTNLASNQANTPVGCTSDPEDGDCQEIIQNLGLPFNGAPAQEQVFFWVD